MSKKTYLQKQGKYYQNQVFPFLFTIPTIPQNCKKTKTVFFSNYPAGLYINLIQNFNMVDLLMLLAINIVPAILFVYVASIFYFKILSAKRNRDFYK